MLLISSRRLGRGFPSGRRGGRHPVTEISGWYGVVSARLEHTSCDSYESLYSGMMFEWNMVSQMLVLHWGVRCCAYSRPWGLYAV